MLNFAESFFFFFFKFSSRLFSVHRRRFYRCGTTIGKDKIRDDQVFPPICLCLFAHIYLNENLALKILTSAR